MNDSSWARSRIDKGQLAGVGIAEDSEARESPVFGVIRRDENGRFNRSVRCNELGVLVAVLGIAKIGKK